MPGGRSKKKGHGKPKTLKVKEPKIKKKKYISPQQKWAKAQKQMQKREMDLHKLEKKSLRKITAAAKTCRQFEIRKIHRRIKQQELFDRGELEAEHAQHFKPMTPAEVEKLRKNLEQSKQCTAADIASVAYKDLPHPTEHLHTPAADYIINEKARRKAANKAARAAGLDPNNLPLPPARPSDTNASVPMQIEASPQPSQAQTAQPAVNLEAHPAVKLEAHPAVKLEAQAAMKLEDKGNESESEEESSEEEASGSEAESDDSESESEDSDRVEAGNAAAGPLGGTQKNAKAVKKESDDEAQLLDVFDDSKEAVLGPFAEKVLQHHQVQEVIAVVKKKLALATEKVEIYKCQCVKWKANAEEAEKNLELHQPPVDYRMKPPGRKSNGGARVESVRKQEKRVKKIEKKQKKAAKLAVKVQNKRAKKAQAEGGSSAANLHPSWAAKKQQTASISAAPKGKKTVFQD